MLSPQQKRYDKLAPRLIKALQSRHFEAYYCADSHEAVDKVLSLIPEGHTVSWGGSQTLKMLGLPDKVSASYAVIDRDKAANSEEKTELMRRALLCDTYLTGSNAISEDGQLVNIDGNGNRVAAMIYGPKSVIVVAGMNKVCKTLDDALQRARNTAAPVNAQRFDMNTPCVLTGSCGDCKLAESICAYFVVTRISRPPKKIKVVLVGQDLGF